MKREHKIGTDGTNNKEPFVIKDICERISTNFERTECSEMHKTTISSSRWLPFLRVFVFGISYGNHTNALCLDLDYFHNAIFYAYAGSRTS